MATHQAIDGRLLKILRCPISSQQLHPEGEHLVSADGTIRYPVVSGIPCLIPRSVEPTHSGYKALVTENQRWLDNKEPITDEQVVEFIQAMLVPTCGNLFRGASLQGKYPIPDFPGHFTEQSLILDVGCNWGRWSIAGAAAGHTLVGMDIHLKSLLSARSLSRRLVPQNEPLFVLADARHMPFAASSFKGVFSYSVIQHFSKDNAALILSEVGRVLEGGGTSLIQMPNRSGLRAMIALARRGLSEGTGFNVRYYRMPELISLFEKTIGRSNWIVDCFFGLNVHSRDKPLVTLAGKGVIAAAAAASWVSRRFPLIASFCDSVFVLSTKPGEGEKTAQGLLRESA